MAFVCAQSVCTIGYFGFQQTCSNFSTLVLFLEATFLCLERHHTSLILRFV